MPLKCKICSHLQRKEIDAVIVSEGASNVFLASKFGFSEASVRRHRDRHLTPGIARAARALGKKLAKTAAGEAAEAKEIASGGALLDRLQNIDNETLKILRAASREKNRELALKAIARIESQIELRGRILGELRSQQLAVTINAPGAQIALVEHPRWPAVREALMRALARFPEARQAVVEALNPVTEAGPKLLPKGNAEP